MAQAAWGFVMLIAADSEDSFERSRHGQSLSYFTMPQIEAAIEAIVGALVVVAVVAGILYLYSPALAVNPDESGCNACFIQTPRTLGTIADETHEKAA